ncbi:MAG TPA: TonB-dependent receptor [Burkholderiaceae bacterium]|jgi:iron complex outermembrane receptor protein
MFKKSSISVAVLVALGSAVVPSMAQDQPQQLERVEITGSSIKRIAAEGSLPVVTMTHADIAKTGATSAADLIQLLPSVQGSFTTSQSVNGGGGGVTTVSLRNLGSKYTLVLLNGRRIASFGTGSAVNLEQLPLAAIERVEVLTDGASALYGSDAIGGVVNFITRKNTTSGEINLSIGAPQRAGGKNTEFSISKGFGSVDADGFNLFGALSYSKLDRILASQRDWTRTGIIPFQDSTGRNLYVFQTSANSNPPNVTLRRSGGLDAVGPFAPTLVTGGNCGANSGSVPLGQACRQDYANTVDLQPATENKSAFVSGDVKLPGTFRLHSELLYSLASVKAGFAPPAQTLSLAVGSSLYNRYVVPALPDVGVDPATVTRATVNLRLLDAGQRASDYQTEGTHFSVGLEGDIGNWAVATNWVHSQTVQKSDLLSGYTSLNGLNDLIAANSYDYFIQGTDASRAALAPAVLHIESGKSTSKLDVLSANASGPVFKIDGRDAMLGLGAEYRIQKYKDMPAPIFQGPNVLQPDYDDLAVGAGWGSLPVQVKRNNYGVYGEFIAPVLKQLELTAAVRYDHYSDVSNAFNFTADGAELLPPAHEGNAASRGTYKLSARFQPVKELLLRASAGTGFRVASLDDIAGALTDAGVTGVPYACPVGAGDPLHAGCEGHPASQQWKVNSGGNPFVGAEGLKPETSKQWSFGLRIEPNENFSAGLDFWAVRIKNAITTVNESAAFADLARYRNLFAVTTESSTGDPILTLNQLPLNAASRVSQGVDWDVILRNKFSFGALTTQFSGTFMTKQYVDFGFGAGKQSSLNQFGPEADMAIAARVLARLTSSLQTGDFTNTLSLAYRPGYTDQSYLAESQVVALRNSDGSRGAFIDFSGYRVPSYYKLDWQGSYAYSKALGFTVGVKNLLDRAPPFTIKTTGGNQVGADARYADVIGRAYYLSGTYKF